MNAELFLFGKRIDMAQRRRRRWLVAAIYLFVLAWVAVSWRLSIVNKDQDRLVTGCIWLALVILLLNQLILGGNVWGALVKPFRAGRKASVSPIPLVLFLRWGSNYMPADSGNGLQNDEREQQAAGRAHYLAYRGMAVMVLAWMVAAMDQMGRRNLLAWFPVPPAQSAFVLMWLSFLVYSTLPQAILLWTEPDMEREQ